MMSRLFQFMKKAVSFTQFQELLRKDVEAFQKELSNFAKNWNVEAKCSVCWPELPRSSLLPDRETYIVDRIDPDVITIPEKPLKYWIVYASDHSFAAVVILDPEQITQICVPDKEDLPTEEVDTIEVILWYENQSSPPMTKSKTTTVKELRDEVAISTKRKEFRLEIEDPNNTPIKNELDDRETLGHYSRDESLVIFVSAPLVLEEELPQPERKLTPPSKSQEEKVYIKQQKVAERILEALTTVHKNLSKVESLEATFNSMEFFVLVQHLYVFIT